MQVIYTYIPETNYVPREYSVAAILLLLFMVFVSLVSVFNLLRFYISTFLSMCAVPNTAVFCSSSTSCFPGLLLLLLLLLLYRILRRKYLLKHVIDGKLEGGIEVMGSRGRRYKHLLDDLKEKIDKGSLRLHNVENSLWKRLWTWCKADRQTDCGMVEHPSYMWQYSKCCAP